LRNVKLSAEGPYRRSFRTRSSASSVDGRCPLGTHHRAVVALAKLGRVS